MTGAQSSPYFTRLIPDWDTAKVIPEPIAGFTGRLQRVPPANGKQLDMKPVDNLWKTFKLTFSGDIRENWADHIDRMETDVFEKNTFYPKQCYYALKSTLRGNAQRCFQNLELNLETPDWYACMPQWFRASNDDLYKMLHRSPFMSFTYALRMAIVVVYFHRKFQKGSAKKAWRRFEDAHQLQNETLEDWAIRLERYELDVKRYGTVIPFDDYLKKWSTGTNPGFFVSELRKAKTTVSPALQPIIRDRSSFQDWKTAMLANALQTRREQETHRELIARSKRMEVPRTPNTRRYKPTPGNTIAKGGGRTNRGNRDGPGYRKQRNPHSLLLADKPANTPVQKTQTSGKAPGKKDRSQVQCFNCLEFGHFTSKCTAPKRDRKQKSVQLQTMLAETTPVYQEDEAATPEAIRDSLRDAMSGFLANVMYAIDPALEGHRVEPEYDDTGAGMPMQHDEEGEQPEAPGAYVPGVTGTTERDDVGNPDHDMHAHKSMTELNEQEVDNESVYTYSEEGISATAATMEVHAAVASIHARPEEERSEQLQQKAMEQRSDSSTSTSDEDSIPEHWTFSDCADNPHWGKDALGKLSLLADMVIPRVEHLAKRKGVGSQPFPFDLDEINQICSWTCMLNITTRGEWTEIMVALLASAMKAWRKGRSARRRLLSKCKRLEQQLGSRPVPKTAVRAWYTECIDRASEQALIRSVFMAAGIGLDYEHAHEDKASVTTGLMFDVTADATADAIPTEVRIHVHPKGMHQTEPEESFVLVHTASSETDAWNFLQSWLPTSERPRIVVRDHMKILNPPTFWTQKNIDASGSSGSCINGQRGTSKRGENGST